MAAHALVCVHRRIGVTSAVQETDWMFALFWTLGIFDAGVIQDGLLVAIQSRNRTVRVYLTGFGPISTTFGLEFDDSDHIYVTHP